jgi:phosphatidylethanolamine-binding protein (PEBP) family uncharacterized protein
MEYVERTIAYLTSNLKGRDPKLFTRPLGKVPAFASPPNPTITVTSTTCGPSGSHMSIEYTQDGADTFPTLTWILPSSIPASSVKEYLLVIQDADAPLPVPITHAIFYNIPGSKTTIAQEDIEKTGKENELKGGFRYGKNLRGTVYGGPRPLRGHGEHRYFYQVIALGEALDAGKLSKIATKEELGREVSVEGRVLGWGEWVGVAERK